MQDSGSILRMACNLKIKKGLLLGSYNILRPQVLETAILPNYQSNHRFFKHTKKQQLSSQLYQVKLSGSLSPNLLADCNSWHRFLVVLGLEAEPHAWSKEAVCTELPTADCNFNMWQHRSSGHWKCYLGARWLAMTANGSLLRRILSLDRLHSEFV